MTSQRVYKKGEILFKEGDKIQNMVFIQSGGVNQCLIKGKKITDMFQLGSNQVLGESSLIGQANHAYSAVATTETKALEVPLDIFKQQFEGLPQAMKLFVRSLCERLKSTTAEVKSNKMEKDSSPCPDEQVPRLFSAIFFTTQHKGEKQKDNSYEVDWLIMRNYCQRVFGESIKRLEQGLAVLVKMKLAKFVMGKAPENPEGPDQLQRIIILDLGAVEGFFEFFQYYFYKPGKADLLKYEESVVNMLEVFLKLGGAKEADRFGIVAFDYAELVEGFKSEMGLNLNNDHFNRLEQKGIMCKRRNLEKSGVRIEFEIKEFKNLYNSWKLIREIEKWNEKGYVDLDEKDEKKPKSEGPVCPQCSAPVIANQKFCGECGHNLKAAA